jgi:hypothetical protein
MTMFFEELLVNDGEEGHDGWCSSYLARSSSWILRRLLLLLSSSICDQQLPVTTKFRC